VTLWGEDFYIQPLGCSSDLVFTAITYDENADQNDLINAVPVHTLHVSLSFPAAGVCSDKDHHSAPFQGINRVIVSCSFIGIQW
jgi:hypothetical protein